MSRRSRLQSPDFQPTSPIQMPNQSQAVPNINEENEGISDDIIMPDENEAKCDHSSHKNDLHSEELKRIYEEMDNLRLQRDQLKKENEELKHSMASSGLRYQAINNDEAKCLLLTGLKPKVLKSVIEYLKKARSPSQKPPKHSMEDQILLTIIKLKHNLVFELLALIFGVSLTTTIDYFWSWIDIMYINLKRLIKMQDRDKIFRTIPEHFKCKFPRLTSIIDCFEVFVEAPSSLIARAQFYSQYKKHTTIKVFISCTPLGAKNFVSQYYGGRASDVQVVKESGFYSKFHMPGDQILADRVPLLRNLLPEALREKFNFQLKK
ncbi:uncharacterized protein [Clytia hemisphaerica]|uniref:uncharacterized protein n=1 Tax=Clytia hemisphaerica TaxID=252671 RepID=UPI0034D63293